MPTVTFIDADSYEYTIDVEAGTSVMQAAVDNGIDAILAECGGACACATCHCYIGSPWADKLDAVSDVENELLGCVAYRQESSRLACQIKLDDTHEGMVINLPESQF